MKISAEILQYGTTLEITSKNTFYDLNNLKLKINNSYYASFRRNRKPFPYENFNDEEVFNNMIISRYWITTLIYKNDVLELVYSNEREYKLCDVENNSEVVK